MRTWLIALVVGTLAARPLQPAPVPVPAAAVVEVAGDLTTASRLPAAVTDLVSVGSPGMDVASAAELRTAATVWAGSAVGDWTRRLPDLRLLGFEHAVLSAQPAGRLAAGTARPPAP